MEAMAVTVERLKKLEEKVEKEYRKVLKNLKGQEYADLRLLILKLAIDTAFHKRMLEALERAYHDAVGLIREYGAEETGGEEIALIPGVPTIAMPLGFGRIGARVPPEEIIEEYLRDFPADVVLPEGDGRIGGIIKKHLELEREMLALYESLSRRAFHPVVRELAREMKRNEEQHEAILSKLAERYSGNHSAGA